MKLLFTKLIFSTVPQKAQGFFNLGVSRSRLIIRKIEGDATSAGHGLQLRHCAWLGQLYQRGHVNSSDCLSRHSWKSRNMLASIHQGQLSLSTRGWSDGSAVTSTWLLLQSWLQFPAPLGVSQPFVIPVTGALMPSCGFCWY